MVTKKELLSNLSEYSSDQVAEAINSGVVTLYELSKSGNLTPLMRKRIEEKLSRSASVNQEHATAIPADIIETGTQNANANNMEENVQPSQNTKIPIVESSDNENEEDTEEQIQEGYSEVISNEGFFKRPFSFKGRIRRSEYGLSVIIYYLWCSFASFTGKAVIKSRDHLDGAEAAYIIFCFISVPLVLWFMWAQGAKRCHDRGNSGLYQFIPFYFF